MKRISSIDITRGLVMIIMALDHVRDYMHVNSLTQSPTDLSTTTPALFFTRWITHLCAPTFVFLAGTSAYLSFKKTKNVKSTRKFLLTRGLWLILLEITIINLILYFDIRFRVLIFEVIGTIGFGFIILSMLLKLPSRTIGIIGVSIIFLHGLVPLIPFANGSVIKTILSPLFVAGATPVSPQFMFVMGYPPIPWLGIMLTGFAAGKLFEYDQQKRKQIFLKIGIAALLLFVVIRVINIYGDPVPWTKQATPLYTFLSFMNISKYPPSLLFSLATLGCTFLILSVAERFSNKLASAISVYGSVPLFYFVLHLLFVHSLMLAMVFIQGYGWNDLVFTNFMLGRPQTNSGVSLAIIYIIWLFVVLCMYPLCKWYSKYKSEHRELKWLRFL